MRQHDWQGRLLRYCIWFSLVAGVGFSTAAGGAEAAKDNTLASDNECGEAQTTILTPNSNAQTSTLHDVNNDIMTSLQTGGTTYWTALLSNSNTEVSLPNNRGDAVVTFQQGLTVKLVAEGSTGTQIFLNGKIIDDLTEYNIVGKLIGVFKC